MSVFEGGWQSVLPAKTDGGPTTGMVRINPGGFTFPFIFTNYSVNLNEKIQVLETFKEFIHLYAFGKAAGQAQIQGQLLEGRGNTRHSQLGPGLLSVYEKQLRALQLAKSGKLAIISGPGNTIIKGVVNNLNYSITGATSNILTFTLNLIIVSSALGVT